ncbi:DUF4124 domain-containing protein [Shewanella sp. OMA3-2]|uniref:DUF4124 domain-containing protein n=1 Tax=Shewanella sp. OMA3-2 TaxID=2908650 RepID=UPI001F2DCFE5|nr:DUF4124 domain-containing protein [Shewanella sp. OMA3-2]UJF22900.1 DUF4124 domain-containing protein [Shewanella sp. OMA3-2]
MKQLLLLVACLLTLSTSMAATIYTWTDSSGVVHYSQQAPKGVDAQRITTDDLEPQKIGTATPIRKAVEAEPESDLAKSAKLIKEKDAKQAESICETAKHSMVLLGSYNRLTKKDPKTGEVIAMTEEDKQAARAENEQRVKLFCN